VFTFEALPQLIDFLGKAPFNRFFITASENVARPDPCSTCLCEYVSHLTMLLCALPRISYLKNMEVSMNRIKGLYAKLSLLMVIMSCLVIIPAYMAAKVEASPAPVCLFTCIGPCQRDQNTCLDEGTDPAECCRRYNACVSACSSTCPKCTP
jgi:hypothetical protein